MLFTGDFIRLSFLLACHLLGVMHVEKTVMNANKKLDRVKSPYLTAFALYLGVNVYGLSGLLVGPLGLCILTVLYESMSQHDEGDDEDDDDDDDEQGRD